MKSITELGRLVDHEDKRCTVYDGALRNVLEEWQLVPVQQFDGITCSCCC